MKLSVVMPAQNEEGSVAQTVAGVVAVLERESVDYEVVVVDDSSDDTTAAVVDAIGEANPRVRCHRSHYERGFGMAIRAGLDVFEGDAVAIVMADASDDPEDLVRYHRLLEDGWDCAFGSRFVPGAQIHDYPRLKLTINRLANWFIRVLFRHRYNDTTNAFKAYRREVIETIQPLLSKHFNLTVEMPLKAIVRGHSYEVIPTNWTNRTSGVPKLAMKEMGSRYLFIVLYVWLENALSRGDYQVRKPGGRPAATTNRSPWRGGGGGCRRISCERAVMLCVLSLAALACALCLVAPPPPGIAGNAQSLLSLVRVAAASALAVTLLLGPGLLWRALSSRRIGLAFISLPGLFLLVVVGGLAWALAGSIEPRLVCFAFFAPLIGFLFGVLLSRGPDDLLDGEEQWALLVVGCGLGFAIARAIWSQGPEGELYGGTVARTLEVGDRSDARISYNVVQLVAHGTHPFSGVGGYYFFPYNFSSRGPLAGLASAPIVFLAGGKPPLLFAEEPWQPFDPAGYMAYRLAMMAFASTAFLSLWGLTHRLVGGGVGARLALLLAVTTPFLMHEVWFTWPKMLAASFVLLAGLSIVERRPWRAGLLLGVGYLMHPGALLGLSALALLALWPSRGASWRRPDLKALVWLLVGAAISVVAWRLVNGDHYTQSGFLEYFRGTGLDFHPTLSHWFAYRGESLGNTLVPMLLPMAFAGSVSINVFGGISPAAIHFFFQYWDGLAFGVGIFFYPLLLLSLWRAWRLWPWPVFATVVAPFVGFTIYWGSSNSGMLREGLQAWVLVLFAVVALQQRSVGFPWLRSKMIRAILVLRAVELVLVAVGPALATRHVLIGSAFTLNDLVAVGAMIGFSACLAALIWTSPRWLEGEGRSRGEEAEVRARIAAEPAPTGG